MQDGPTDAGPEFESDDVSEQDMINFTVDQATPELRKRIGRQLEDPESFASRWIVSKRQAIANNMDAMMRMLGGKSDDGSNDEVA